MHGATSEESLVERPWCNTRHDNRPVASTERDEALHHRVEVIVRQVVEEHTQFWWCPLELKTVTMNRLDSDRHQCQRVWARGTAQVRDHHLLR